MKLAAVVSKIIFCTQVLALLQWLALFQVAAFTATTTTTKTITISSSPCTTTTTTTRHSRARRHYNDNGAYKKNAKVVVSTRTTTTRLSMAWGPDPVWSAAAVTFVQDACPSGKSVSVRVTVPAETAASYRVPGQYVQIRPASSSTSNSGDDVVKPAFLAICSAPDPENAVFDFLIKRTDSNAWLTDQAVVGGGAAAASLLQVSQVLGGGYATAENLDGFKYDFPTQNVLLFAAGSGIAPIAAAIESGQLLTTSNNSRTCRLYYGEQTSADLCFVEKFAAWEELGVQVVPVLSQPPAAGAGAGGDDTTADSVWKGRTGYLQTALAEDGIAIPRNTGALLCGMKGMTESVKELLLASGVFEGRVLFNF